VSGETFLLVDGGRLHTLDKRCAATFEAGHGGTTYGWPWIELVDRFVMLLANSDLSIERLEEREKV